MSTTPAEAIAPRPPSAAAAAIPRSERSLAPDIARGAMLLFIALANVGMLLWGRATDAAGRAADARPSARLRPPGAASMAASGAAHCPH